MRQQRDYLTIVQESADSLLTIINEILDFSKIEAGRLELECRTLKFMRCRRIHLSHWRSGHIPSRSSWHVISTKMYLMHLMGDAARLRQVLVNLVGNAIKFTEHGEVVVHVRQHERSGDRALIEFQCQRYRNWDPGR